MGKKIGIGLGVLLMILGIVIATRPASYTVRRSMAVSTPASFITPLLADFHRWGEWSPWDRLDPNMKKTFDGPSSGVGAITAWSGNSDVGEGRMTVVGLKPDEQVDIKLEFIKPFAATSQTMFTLRPIRAEVTEVTWIMNGTNDFMGKAFSLFVDMDKAIGADFERGLRQLKALAEAEAARQHAAIDPARNAVPPPTAR